MPQVIRFVIVIVSFYLLLCVALFIFQRSLIYFPQTRIILANETNLKLPMEEGNVLVSIRAQQGNNALIYFGGNSEEVSQNLPDFSAAFPEYSIYLLHYRGYGGSAGKPSEEGIIKDALALFDKVYAEHKNIILIGRSLGSGVAVQVASMRPAHRLILVTPYNSIKEIAAARFPFMPSWLLQDKYESWRYVPKIHIPTLILAAEEDEVIPPANTELLYSHFNKATTTFKVLANTRHNTISSDPHYFPSIQDFTK